ncbi:MAG TPA: metal ABC transporter substrate-binding protein [Burkholderiaceae bacterium]|nr:metal ABC transporter substrate-binding protein [Burkholderiaceae bacterium]
MLRALVLALALAAAPGHVLAQQKLRIVTTSADLKSLVEAVGGARVDVESLAAPEQDPHTIELKPAQLARVRGAALLIRVGLDHEPWLAKVRLPESVSVVDASRGVQLIQTQTPRLRVERSAHVHAFGNTHYWLDPANAIPITAAIRDALAKLSPHDAQLFEMNRTAFIDALAQKIEGWKKMLAPFRGAKMVVMHDTWSYFAERFGLQIVAAAEPRPGVPPSPSELATLFQRMRASGVKILIADPHSNPSLVRQIAANSGAHAVTLSPSGHDYIALLDQNVTRLVEALKRTSP